MKGLPKFTAPTAELEAYGRTLRQALPRRDQGRLVLPERDSIAIMERQHADRLQSLIPVRVARMLESPFAFYRGSAALMAHDLADAPTIDVGVIACGDAHISNFGWYASPERALTFDLNDFDEASNAPWEWDLKRLVTSAYIAALDNGLCPDQARDIARAGSTAYRWGLAELMKLPALERYYFRVESDWLEERLDNQSREVVKRTRRKAEKNNSDRVIGRIETIGMDDRITIIDQPPIMLHSPEAQLEISTQLLNQFLKSVREDIAILLTHYVLQDVVLRVVGVGSVGTRCFILLLTGPHGEPFFLQIKEAQKTVLETYGKRVPKLFGQPIKQGPGFNGKRVIACQRTLQSVSDPFLGHFHTGGVDYYVRQFRDMKGSFDIASLNAELLDQYVRLCGALLARGHSQSPNAGIINGYLDGSKRFDDAMTDWAIAYFDVMQRDFEDLEKAVKSGRVPVEHDA
ncbi:MAG: DUF2252 domain-containing protein [Thermomicrobiales bacterium]|nr:DUF2252 domain-containing protein [Thermomicrobiales bacterium]